MRSNLMKQGLEKYPHRSLLKAMGLTDREIDQPIIGVANSYNEFIPGHIHLDKITQAAKAGVRLNGGTPLEFGVIGVCDGLAMNHAGMRFSLPSREGHPKLFTRFLDRHYHPMDGVMMHRVSFHGKDVVYATDIEVPSGGDIDAVSHFCMDADVLICDTQYEDKEYAGHYEGFGHNSMDMTIRLTQASTIKQLILFHHAPDRDDVALAHLQEVARARFPHTQAAYEGLVIQL